MNSSSIIYDLTLPLSFHDSGIDFNLTANYNGFNTTMYNRQGCGSSTCEGVAILKMLHVSVPTAQDTI